MFKIISNLKARPDLSREEFLERWRNQHKEIILRLPCLIKYRQSPAIDHKNDWPFNGLAELWFNSLNDIRLAFSSDVADEMREDEKNIFSEITWYIVQEGIDLYPEGK